MNDIIGREKEINVLDRYQILQLYMVMGGIPFYLDAVSPEKSAAQNIEELCFRKGALLVTEFPNLFASLFKNAEKYETIITALSSKTKKAIFLTMITTYGLDKNAYAASLVQNDLRMDSLFE